MKKENKKGLTRTEADSILILITLGWGFSYILMDYSLTELSAFNLNMYRFLLASFVAFIIRRKDVISSLNKTTIKYGLLIGMFLFLCYTSTTYGIQFTTVSNTGFLCASTVVFTPLFSLIFFKKKPELKTVISVIVCFIGMGLLTIGDDFSMSSKTLLGDILSIMCGFFYAFDLLTTERAVSKPDVDAYTLGTLVLFTVGVLNFIFAGLIDGYEIPKTNGVVLSTLFLALVATGFAFIMQPIAQKYTTASRVGVIFTLEPVFNAFAAYFILHEVLSLRGYIGSAIMIIAILVMEINFKKKDE